MDLFEHALKKRAAGWKAGETSHQAAVEMTERAGSLRERCLRTLSRCESPDGLTADEVADVLGETILSIRPRISELLKLGLIEDSFCRRPNASGKPAISWRMKRGKPCTEPSSSSPR